VLLTLKNAAMRLTRKVPQVALPVGKAHRENLEAVAFGDGAARRGIDAAA